MKTGDQAPRTQRPRRLWWLAATESARRSSAQKMFLEPFADRPSPACEMRWKNGTSPLPRKDFGRLDYTEGCTASGLQGGWEAGPGSESAFETGPTTGTTGSPFMRLRPSQPLAR
jgi:hypothetical protein